MVWFGQALDGRQGGTATLQTKHKSVDVIGPGTALFEALCRVAAEHVPAKRQGDRLECFRSCQMTTQ